MLNYDWLLSGEAVDAVGAGRIGDASLKHSSRDWVTGWFQANQSPNPTMSASVKHSPILPAPTGDD